jgi:hypothetical protein
MLIARRMGKEISARSHVAGFARPVDIGFGLTAGRIAGQPRPRRQLLPPIHPLLWHCERRLTLLIRSGRSAITVVRDE